MIWILLLFHCATATFPSQPCGRGTHCNLLDSYCDTVINSCSSCADDCDPSRTVDRTATDICEKNCASWYLKTNPSSVNSQSIKTKLSTGRFNDTDGSYRLPFVTCGENVCDLTRQFCLDGVCVGCGACANKRSCPTCNVPTSRLSRRQRLRC